MKALVYHKNNDLRLEERDIPRIDENEALIRIRAAAICGTDLRIKAFGHRDIPEGQTRILGHELAGEIVETGRKVRSLKPSMRVAIAPGMGCGNCRHCRCGMQNLCSDYNIMGLGIDGGFAEYMRIPEQYMSHGNIINLPDSISFEVGSIIEPLGTVFTGAEACMIKPSDIVLIIGAGPIGIMHMMMAKVFGAQKVIVSEMVKSRRDQALDFGADHVIDPAREDLKKILPDLSYGRGPDIIIIAAPSPEAQELSLELIALGGHINFFGTIPPDRQVISINSNLIHYKRINIVGTTGSSVVNFHRAAELLISKRLDISGLISDTFPLEQAGEAFIKAMSKEVFKIILIP